MWAVLKIATFISTLIVGAHAANAASVHIIGDVTAGTGQLVISDDLYFTINGTNDPTHLIFSDWNTGFGQLASPTDNWLDRVRASEFTDTTGGVLGISAQTPFSETDNRFVGTSSRFGSNGVQSNALTSGPRLIDTGNHTRMFFDDAFQNIRLLDQDQRNTLIIEAGIFNLPEIPDFTGETYATSVQVRGHSGFGFPARSNTLQLAPPPAPVPVPAALSLLMSAFCGLGLMSWRRTRTIAS